MPGQVNGVYAACGDFYAKNDPEMGARPSPVLSVLGSTVTHLRGAMPQRELARRSGLDVGSISRLENGKFNPSVKTLEKIASVLGTTVPSLFSEVPVVEPARLPDALTTAEADPISIARRALYAAETATTPKFPTSLLAEVEAYLERTTDARIDARIRSLEAQIRSLADQYERLGRSKKTLVGEIAGTAPSLDLPQPKRAKRQASK